MIMWYLSTMVITSKMRFSCYNEERIKFCMIPNWYSYYDGVPLQLLYQLLYMYVLPLFQPSRLHIAILNVDMWPATLYK